MFLLYQGWAGGLTVHGAHSANRCGRDARYGKASHYRKALSGTFVISLCAGILDG